MKNFIQILLQKSTITMASRISIVIKLILLSTTVCAQQLKWNTDLQFYFDNTEFSRSSYTTDQTMAGVTVSQHLSWQFDTNHHIVVGVDASKYLGSHNLLNDIHLLAAYRFEDTKTLLNVGVFERHDLLDDYSNFFFQDSIKYYKHTINGLFLKRGDDSQYLKMWLDWTGWQSETERESFLAGVSAYKELNSRFFLEFQSYLYHLALTKPAIINDAVYDNALAQASVGFKYSDKNWRKIIVSGGVLAGFERNRKFMNAAYSPIGFVGRADVAYKKWGTENLLYAGEQRMKLYGERGNELYWGNPFLRGRFYFQNKVYWKIFETKNVTGELASRHHVSQGKVFFEQLFTLSASIGN